MSKFSRRVALAGVVASAGGVLLPSVAQATVVRGLSLPELAKGSRRILVGTALEANAHWEVIGGRRRIVTDTRLRVDEMVNDASADSELLVRTLGGTVGDIGAKVHGEALLNLNERCMVFLQEPATGIHRVVGMAQGHYPVRPDAQRALRLQMSPQAPELVGKADFATLRLRGLELNRAKLLIREALAQ